ncbi:MAG TPA: biotin/lipoyl-binding protein [Accumulibacter sp.]|nr:biotin/lipoyl-binding protein [Accumulibacter sp.]
MHGVGGEAGFAQIAALEARARAADTLVELAFSIANDSYALLPFRQALVFDGAGRDAALLAVSGLARPAEDSPYLVWLRRCWPWLVDRLNERLNERLGEATAIWQTLPADAPAEIADGWREWWPTGVFAQTIRRRSGEGLGWAVYLLDTPPNDSQVAMVAYLAQSWGYGWEMLTGRGDSPARRLRQWLSGPRRRWLAAAVAALLLMPVRQSALAPAEVIPLDAAVVASPLDGVIRAVHVRPNQPVKAGQRLFSLDDTPLRNRLEVAQKSIAVADAELMATTQKSFDTPQSRSELAPLTGRAHEKRAELAAVNAQLGRIDVTAAEDGVVVFGDPEDWRGKPVSTGERIMLLAKPDRPGVLVHLPVADAITLDVGAPMTLFLTVQPLQPLDATLTETSYQAVLSPDGIASYRLRGTFAADDSRQARIGLRGTAKVYGGWACLGYAMLRRPLASFREWSGW